MSSSIADILEPHYRPRRLRHMACWVVFLLAFAAVVASAVSVAIVGYDGGVYVPQSVCRDGDKNYDRCARKYREEENERRASAAITGRLTLSVFPLLIAGVFFALWWPIRGKGTPALVRRLRERPLDVVWVHASQTNYRRYGRVVSTSAALVIGTIDKYLHKLPMPTRDVDRVIPLLRAEFPHATFGYDPSLQPRFYADPASMRRTGVAPSQQAAPAAPQQPPAPGGALRVWVAPQVVFGHIDHAMRTIGLTAEVPAPAVAPGEPGAAAWSAPLARVIYRFDPLSRSRSLELYAQDPAGLRGRIASTGLPISG